MNLKQLRENIGFSQGTVAMRLNVDQSAVSKWENGVYPPLKKYRRMLAKLYACKMDELLQAIEESKRKDA